jgi:integrase
MQRKRKSTTNRILTVLKAALNHAWKNGNTTRREEWQKVEPFKDVDAPKVAYLTEDQAGGLLAAASEDFRPMARAALLTGCRYGELTRLKVSDLERDQLFIEKTKTGKPRHVPLSAAGIKFFKALAKGKTRNELLLTHQDGSNWERSHQTRPMRQACEKAAIDPPVGFHVLRHTYATLLLRTDGSQGVSIRYVAALIGDSVATCEKHYGHVIQDDLRKEVARKLPSFGGEI